MPVPCRVHRSALSAASGARGFALHRPRGADSFPRRAPRRAAAASEDADTGDARLPAEAVEDLAQNGTADEAAEEVGGEIGAARSAPVRGRGAADEAGLRRPGDLE